MVRRMMISTLKQAKRLIVCVIGFTVLFIGVVMIVTPGPGFVVILAGLAILATEFLWARRLLQRVKEKATQMAASVSGKQASKSASTISDSPPKGRRESL
jgi:tellurite resistance protein TerC/cation:H+ antiporter